MSALGISIMIIFGLIILLCFSQLSNIKLKDKITILTSNLTECEDDSTITKLKNDNLTNDNIIMKINK